MYTSHTKSRFQSSAGDASCMKTAWLVYSGPKFGSALSENVYQWSHQTISLSTALCNSSVELRKIPKDKRRHSSSIKKYDRHQHKVSWRRTSLTPSYAAFRPLPAPPLVCQNEPNPDQPLEKRVPESTDDVHSQPTEPIMALSLQPMSPFFS